MRVKICGITNYTDAKAAADAGADYLGFIFYPASKRSIAVETCWQIVGRLRSGGACPILVGVFVNESASTMAGILDRCQLDLAQLSGDEVPSLIGDASSPIYGRSYKALRPTSLVEAKVEAEWYLPPQKTRNGKFPALLVDAHHPTLRGGTGEKADWNVCASLARTIPGLMLAGGLNPSNIKAAVKKVRPFAVDVASGVEASPGRKDHARLRRFIANTKVREV